MYKTASDHPWHVIAETNPWMILPSVDSSEAVSSCRTEFRIHRGKNSKFTHAARRVLDAAQNQPFDIKQCHSDLPPEFTTKI